jgi:signal transduction histidine kinase
MKTGPGLGLQRFVDGAWQTLELQGLSSAALPVTALFVDREDSLWVGTVDRGVYRVRSGRVDHYDSADGLSSDGVLSFFQDREGSIWVATDRGLDKFRNMHVASYSRREGLSSNSVATVVAAQDGTLWIGNLNSLDRLRQGRVHSIRAGSGLPGTQVTSLFEDRERRLWVGLDTGVAVLEQGRFRLITGTGSRAMGTIVGITQDREGDIWLLAVAEPTKLVRIHDLQVQEEIAAPDIPRTRRMVADPRGGLWLGLTNGDLAHYMNGRVQIVPFGLPRHAAAIHALITTPDNAVLAATSSGVIASRGGAPYTLSTRNGLPCDRISSLIFDRSGALWLYAACGLISIPADELAKWWAQPGARVRFKWLDASDGVQHAITPFQPAAARSPDGRLWFASESVLQTVDPERLDLNTLAPPVHIDAVVADRRDYAANDGVRFQPRTRDIEIKYTALSFAVPEKVLFRYRLEGHDDEWHEAGTRRHAFYTDLPPGDYRFQVIASNNDGVWNETGASLRFSIEPTFYQTRTFAILCCAAVIGGVWLLISLRVRQVAKRMQMRLEERLFERERIARELHDTLLQGMLSASLQLSVANSQIAANAPAKPLVERILQLLRQAIDEGRNALHDLRERHAGPGELERAFAQIPQDLGTEDTISYRLIVEGTPRPLRPLVRDEVYRIGREALANAFRHSAASLIEAVLEFDRQHFRLVVRDDGCGIDPEVVRSGREGHWGLSGMRERSEKIGAEIKVRSGAAAGTEIELIIPAVTAFEGRGERRSTDWFARLRGEKRRDECSDSHTRGR